MDTPDKSPTLEEQIKELEGKVERHDKFISGLGFILVAFAWVKLWGCS